MIPFRHDVEIIKSGGLNDWGEVVAGETLELKGNIRSRTNIVVSLEGKETVSTFNILFEGFVKIVHKDKIRFVEPNEEIITSPPIAIKYLRDIDGSVAFTKVNM